MSDRLQSANRVGEDSRSNGQPPWNGLSTSTDDLLDPTRFADWTRSSAATRAEKETSDSRSSRVVTRFEPTRPDLKGRQGWHRRATAARVPCFNLRVNGRHRSQQGPVNLGPGVNLETRGSHQGPLRLTMGFIVTCDEGVNLVNLPTYSPVSHARARPRVRPRPREKCRVPFEVHRFTRGRKPLDCNALKR